MTRSAEKSRQARERSSSRVMGPVVSWLPTVASHLTVLAGGDAAGAADYLLREGVPRDPGVGVDGDGEDVGRGDVAAEGAAGLGGDPPADDEGDPSPGADLVEEDARGGGCPAGSTRPGFAYRPWFVPRTNNVRPNVVIAPPGGGTVSSLQGATTHLLMRRTAPSQRRLPRSRAAARSTSLFSRAREAQAQLLRILIC
jgi:hypothetical protein